ncbi:MAG: hypothetical protein FWC43_10075, partial [Planctomycetaceae bacterium]|nr:hypothetical protein [Planctomycetaceae bacterium]
MKQKQKTDMDEQTIQEILGYLNFSSGARDVRFFTAMNRAFEQTSPQPPKPIWLSVVEQLRTHL